MARKNGRNEIKQSLKQAVSHVDTALDYVAREGKRFEDHPSGYYDIFCQVIFFGNEFKKMLARLEDQI